MSAADDVREQLRALPAVDRVLAALPGGVRDGPEAAGLARAVLDELRASILAGGEAAAAGEATVEAVAAETARRLALADGPYPRVVNATGVMLHTGLGRAPLAPAAARALAAAADGYCLLEVDRESGDRKHREAQLVDDLVSLTGAESATVVNNCAAALLLALKALGGGKEVVVSRGELIEIGGGFRLPELMGLSGAKLVEVGTTNRTYVEDYAKAIGPETGLMLTVHTSNYRLVGFHHAPERAELVALARERGVPLLEDTGSGLLSPAGGVLEHEPAVSQAIAEGVDLVMFSGDKLLGGPQAGVLVGREALVARCRRDTLFRAVRPDRLALTALAATLALHKQGPDKVPVLEALVATAPRARLERARQLAERLALRYPDASFRAEITDGRVGSGASPGREIGSAAVEIEWPGLSAEALGARLRSGRPCVFGREWRARFRLDVLAMRPGDEGRIEAALAALP